LRVLGQGIWACRNIRDLRGGFALDSQVKDVTLGAERDQEVRMEKFGKSQPVKRVEDIRFLTGTGRYVDDIAPDHAYHAFVFRSPVAHGVITELDVSDAESAEGVKAVLTGESVAAAGVNLAMAGALVRNIDGTRGASPERPLLALGRVRHVGEAVAVVIAQTVQQAKDAAELIMFDVDELPAHLDLSFGGDAIHEEAPVNLAFDWGMGDKDAVDTAIAAAAHVVKVTVPDNRIIVNSLEPRGCFAEFEDGRLHVAVNGQGVWGTKGDLVHHLGLPASDIRVTNPDVGGGFGMKGMCYPETILVGVASRMLGHPVRWMSERTEAMLTDNAGRDLTSDAVLAFDADHRLIAYKVENISNLGAYNSQFAQFIQSDLFSKVAAGTYDFQHIWINTKGVFTNTTPVDAYRGAGRPEAIFVLERAMDQAAREMGIDPWELRRINFIKPDNFPYTSATGMPYDVGEFKRLLDIAETKSDRAGFAKRQAEAKANGKLLGMGLCYYIESILGDPDETTRVDFNDDGTASIFVGTQSGGQGHETVFAQFLSDHTGIPLDKVRFVQGDSDLIPKGGGTGGSRSVTVQNTATLATVDQIISEFGAFFAETEGLDPSEVSFDDERFRLKGSNLSPTMLEAAQIIRDAGREDLLSQSATIVLESRSFPNGAHVAEVEIDADTGVTKVVRYTVVDDFGNLINPMLVEGQIHGGVAQGVGQAITEQTVYDESGQLLTASFMDYGMPRADDMPWVSFTSVPVPSKYNPMGMKGCGEAGTVGALAAVTNAVIDALGGKRMDMPFTPHRVWKALQEADRGAS